MTTNPPTDDELRAHAIEVTQHNALLQMTESFDRFKAFTEEGAAPVFSDQEDVVSYVTHLREELAAAGRVSVVPTPEATRMPPCAICNCAINLHWANDFDFWWAHEDGTTDHVAIPKPVETTTATTEARESLLLQSREWLKDPRNIGAGYSLVKALADAVAALTGTQETAVTSEFDRAYAAGLEEAARIAEGSLTDDLECDARARLIAQRIRDSRSGVVEDPSEAEGTRKAPDWHSAAIISASHEAMLRAENEELREQLAGTQEQPEATRDDITTALLVVRSYPTMTIGLRMDIADKLLREFRLTSRPTQPQTPKQTGPEA